MKYDAIIKFGDGEEMSVMEECGGAFDSVEDAMEAAYECLSDMRVGAEVLNMSNPGDYPISDDDFDADIDIVAIDD